MFREVVQLDHLSSHSIHVLVILWIRLLDPLGVFFPCLWIDNVHTVIPLSFNFASDRILLEHLPVNFEIGSLGPTSMIKLKLTVLVSDIQVSNTTLPSKVHIRCPNDKVVHTDIALSYLELLTSAIEFNVESESRMELKTLACELRLRPNVTPHSVASFSFHMYSSDRRMMRNLLSKVSIVSVFVLIGLSKQGVKWLCVASLNECSH